MQGHRTYLDLSRRPDLRERVLIAPRKAGHRQFSEPKKRGLPVEIDRETFNALRASRKADREAIAATLEAIAAERGATLTERREEPASPGYSGQSIALRFACKGVGAMVDVDDLHGGKWVLISWFNAEYPARNFSARFCRHTGNMRGGAGCERPHHKTTSQPGDWYSLAMMLDAGLMLAARGEAFEPAKAEASAT